MHHKCSKNAIFEVFEFLKTNVDEVWLWSSIQGCHSWDKLNGQIQKYKKYTYCWSGFSMVYNKNTFSEEAAEIKIIQ